MEMLDIVDEKGMPVGKTVPRQTAHAEGICHRTAHIWIVRSRGGSTEVLLQKRSENKDSFPGQYDTSSAGHMQAGDEPLEAAMRELKEEMGIEARPEDLEFAGTFRVRYEKEFRGKLFRDNEIAFVFVYRKDVDISRLHLQKEELDGAEWFDIMETYRACQKRDPRFCVPRGGLAVLMKYLGIEADESRENESR